MRPHHPPPLQQPALAAALVLWLLAGCAGGGGGDGASKAGSPAGATPPAITLTGNDGSSTGEATDGSAPPAGATPPFTSGLEPVAVVDGTLRYPVKLAATAQGQLLVADAGHHRVLMYPGIPEALGAPALLAVGQAAPEGQAPSPGTLSWPLGVATAGSRMAVADTFNHRVLLYNQIPSASGAMADIVLGQPDTASNTPGCAPGQMQLPFGVALTDEGRVLVADTVNNRVLVWHQWPTRHGQPPDAVIGQVRDDTCRMNDSDGDGLSDPTASGASLYYPEAVWTDGRRLLVVDTNNSRVLAWDRLPGPGEHGRPADRVLGQRNLAGRALNDRDGDGVSDAPSASTLHRPADVHSDGTRVVVADEFNHRVLVWNAWPATNGAAADAVLGQPDFASATPGNGRQGMNAPRGVLLRGARLVVSDGENHRLLVFTAP